MGVSKTGFDKELLFTPKNKIKLNNLYGTFISIKMQKIYTMSKDIHRLISDIKLP